MRLFHLSIAYLTLLFAAIAVGLPAPLGPLVALAPGRMPMISDGDFGEGASVLPSGTIDPEHTRVIAAIRYLES